ncbi:unnamed protein product [Rhodiola kirilowii]
MSIVESRKQILNDRSFSLNHQTRRATSRRNAKSSQTSVRSIALFCFRVSNVPELSYAYLLPGNMNTPSSNTSSQPSSGGQTSKNSRGKGIGRGTGRGGARNVTCMPLQRISNLSAVRPPRQQTYASTDGRNNPIGDYIPQPVADPSPHLNDTNMDAGKLVIVIVPEIGRNVGIV